MIAFTAGAALALAVIVCLGVLLIRQLIEHRRQRKQLEDLYNQLMDSARGGYDKTRTLELLQPNVPINQQADDLPYDREFELPKDAIEMDWVRNGKG